MKSAFLLLFLAVICGFVAGDCPEVASYGNARWLVTPAGVRANGTCLPGWAGTPRRLCKTDNTWASSLDSHCARVYCPAVVEGNANWIQTQGVYTRVGTCLPGYGGYLKRDCDGVGAWTPIIGSCSKCTGEYYGRVNWTDTPARAYDYGTCDLGYYGSPYRFCMDGGVWQSYIWNVCKRANCTGATLDNAIWPTTQTFDYSTGSCVSGFVGTPRRQCNGDGTWGPVINPCQSASAKCPAETYARANWTATNAGNLAVGVCQRGWQGAPTRQCTNSAIWSTSVSNHCIRKTCAEETFNGITFGTTEIERSALGVCPSGTTGTPYRYCTIDAVWNTVISGKCQ